MKRKLLSAVVGILALTGCQSTATNEAAPERSEAQPTYAEFIRDSKPPAGPLHEVREGVIDPTQAIIYAAQSAPNGHTGTFGMQVRNIGGDSRRIYLNSELNYREQLNISVRMDIGVAQYLRRQYGNDWLNEIVGKQIEVEGEVERVVIWLNCNGERTDSYYYQTQIHVRRPEQFKVL